MALFRTEKFKVGALTRGNDCLSFSVSSKQAEILQYVQDPALVKLRKKSALALAATLRFLHQEGTLTLSEAGAEDPFHIDYDRLHKITENTLRSILGLRSITPREMAPPPLGSFSLVLTSHGEAGRPGFGIVPSVRYKHKTIYPSQIRGPIFADDGALILMPEAAWRCFEAFRSPTENADSTLLGHHYQMMAMAQTFARYDYIKVDDFIARNPVTSPQSVALSVDRDEQGLICSVHPEGVPKEAFQRVFARAGEDVPDAYSVESEDKVLRVFFEPKTREQLRKIARKRRVKNDEIKEFIEDPAEFFGIPEESTYWDLTGLSGRVRGWGIFLADSVMISPSPVSALDTVFLSFAAKALPNGSHDTDAPPALEEACLNAEQLQEILVALDAAIETNQPFLELSLPPIVITAGKYEAFRRQVLAALDKIQEQQRKAAHKVHILSAANDVDVLHGNTNFERDQEASSFFSPFQIPDGIRRLTKKGRPVQAYQHQAEGISWLRALYNRSKQGDMGCLLADDMGLGKTFQVISFLASIQADTGPGPTLIVCPTTLLKNWASEIENFTTEEAGWRVSVMASGSKAPASLDSKSIIITNYEQLYGRNKEFFLSTLWRAIFLDEAQKFKNSGGLLHNYLRNLKSPFKVALTGTPVENRLLDLWSIFDVVHPGLLGPRCEFIDTFEVPLRNLPSGSEERRALRSSLEQKMGAHFLRRTKALLKDRLPTITRHGATYCEMSPIQRERYGTIVNKTLNSSTPILPAMLKLLRISSHPAAEDATLLHLDDPDRLIKLSGKLEKTMELAEEIRRAGCKMIIFEKFIVLQEILSVAVATRFGIKPLCINSEVAPGHRKRLVDEWDSTEGFNVLIMSPRTGGAGLTITSANHVIHFTREYNPAVEMQATDRVYRIGQKRPVEVHYPISVPTLDTAKDSIEHHLDCIQRHKQSIADDFTLPKSTTQGSDAVQDNVDGGSTFSALSHLLGLSSNNHENARDCINEEIREAIDEVFGDRIEWTVQRAVDHEIELSILHNESSGEGILIYNAREKASLQQLPPSLCFELSRVQDNIPTLRALTGRILVCSDEKQVQSLSEAARTEGVKLTTAGGLSYLLQHWRNLGGDFARDNREMLAL